MEYRLSNGEIINQEKIFIAMASDNIFNRYFLDIKTGKVIFISEEFDMDVNEHLKEIKTKLNQRYFEIPKISEEKRRSWMKEFVDLMIDEEILRNKLNFVLGKSRTFQLFEKVLYNDKSGWIWGWVQNKVFNLSDELVEWFEKMKFDVKEEWEYDDDCSLCQLLKISDEKGREPTLEETKKAFLEANKSKNN